MSPDSETMARPIPPHCLRHSLNFNNLSNSQFLLPDIFDQFRQRVVPRSNTQRVERSTIKEIKEETTSTKKFLNLKVRR